MPLEETQRAQVYFIKHYNDISIRHNIKQKLVTKLKAHKDLGRAIHTELILILVLLRHFLYHILQRWEGCCNPLPGFFFYIKHPVPLCLLPMYSYGSLSIDTKILPSAFILWCHCDLIIIPLRPYLEKIKGCRRPDIFHIHSWARWDTLYPAVSTHLMMMHTYPELVFPFTHSQAREFYAQQRRVWTWCVCLFLCLLSTYLVGTNHVIL